MARNYNGKPHKPNMHNIEPADKNRLFYVDRRARKTYNRRELCIKIKNGDVIRGHIRNINGRDIPCKNPVGSKEKQ